MKSHFTNTLSLFSSSTAKDTSILFVGNVFTAITGFVLTILLARAISVYEMGVFSAFTNLMLLLGSISDPGISAGLVKFISESKTEREKDRYASAALKIQLIIFLILGLIIFVFSSAISKNLLATTDTIFSYLLILAVLGQILWIFTSSTLKARMKFKESALVDSFTGTFRLGLMALLIFSPYLSLATSTFIYALATIASSVIGFYLLKKIFLGIVVNMKDFRDLIKFSSWLGVNKVASVIAGKIDIQMIALFVGATSTGYYSIPSRLIFFVSVLISSFSAVIAPRLASFNNKAKEKDYVIKTLLFSWLIVAGLCLWYLLSDPFITILFGDKYSQSVPLFRLLLISMVPFVLTAPSVNAIIYGMKRPGLVGYFSIFQLIAVIILNYLFLPRFGAIGATYTLIFTNTALALYSWFFTLKHYFIK